MQWRSETRYLELDRLKGVAKLYCSPVLPVPLQNGTEMDFRSFIMERIDDEFHFIIEAGVSDEGGSPSTKFVNNEASVIDVDPLTAVYPSEFAKNIGDSDDAPSEQDKVTLIDHTTAEKTQN
ncbi:hypothetical protein Tco_0500377 [Tanacetum coccineum]